MEDVKNIVVEFTGTGVRFHKCADVESFRNSPNCLINPEIPKGIAPHFWKLRDGKIEVMEEPEQFARTQIIAKHAADETARKAKMHDAEQAERANEKKAADAVQAKIEAEILETQKRANEEFERLEQDRISLAVKSAEEVILELPQFLTSELPQTQPVVPIIGKWSWKEKSIFFVYGMSGAGLMELILFLIKRLSH